MQVASFHPAATRRIPNKPFHEQPGMLSIVCDDARFGRHALDILNLNLLHYLHNILCEHIHDCKYTALPNRGVGSVESKVVWDVWSCYAEVRKWILRVNILEVMAVRDNGDPRNPGGIETGGKDNSVDFNFIAIGVDKASWGELCEGCAAVGGHIICA